MHVDLSITLPGTLEQVVRWARELIRAANPEPEIVALTPRLQLADGESLEATGSGDGVSIEGRLTVSSHGSQTEVDLRVRISAEGEGLLDTAESAAALAAGRMEMNREWPAARDQIITAFQRWQATGVIDLPHADEPIAQPQTTWPDGVDWSPETLQRNRAGWPTAAQRAKLEAAMPPPRARHWWRRRRPDTRKPFLADLADGRCAIVQGLPHLPGIRPPSAPGEEISDGTVAGVSLKGLGDGVFSTREIQVFYWPHTSRVMNWSFPPTPQSDPVVFTIVRRSAAGQELDRATVTLPD